MILPIRTLLGNYLNGNDISDEQADIIASRASEATRVVYRAMYKTKGTSHLAQKRKASRKKICSVSLSADAAITACKSYAHDYEKDITDKEIVVIQITNPQVCVSHDVLKRYLKFVQEYEYIQALLVQEQEEIILGSCYGHVVRIC